MDDQELLNAIDRMVSEEQRLLHAHESEGLSAEDHARMQDLHVRLDQAWDLLRRRQAAREYGSDPEQVAAQPESQVEGYLQ